MNIKLEIQELERKIRELKKQIDEPCFISNREGYKIKINNKNYTHPNKIITGSEIKTTDGALSKHAVFLKIRGWGQDKQIADNEQIELDKSEIKHFFTTPLNITEG